MPIAKADPDSPDDDAAGARLGAVSTDDAPGDQPQELHQAASAIVALARVLTLPTTSDNERRRVVEAIERTARSMLLRLGAAPPDSVDSPDAAPPA
jgi:hypothetical protein